MLRFRIPNTLVAARPRATAPLLGLLLGTVVACGDDATQQSTESETEGSSSGSSDGSATMTTTEADSSTGGSSSTGTTTQSTTMTTSNDSSGGACVIVPQLFDDPSFEAGPNASPWGEASSAFGTPLCDDSCGGPTASDGSIFVWLGGSNAQDDVGGVAQDLTINASDSATLTFDFWWGSSGSGSDVFQLQIDGNVVWEVTGADAANYPEWTQVELDVSAYADGNDHDFDFTGIATAGASFYLDNVSLESCGDGTAITESDTVDAAMTGGGETDTDTTGGMLTCEDLGNTVPLSQAGNNAGAGNDSTGSCWLDFGQNPGEDVAYTWTAPADGVYRFDTVGSTIADTVLYVLEDCMGGAEIACNEDIADGNFLSALTMSMTEGQTVAIVVDGWSDQESGDFVLNISQVGCDTPDDLGNNTPIEFDDDNSGAGDDVSGTCGGVGGEDVVYTWTAQEDGIYAIYAVSLQMSPVVYGYGSSCGNPDDEIGCGAGNGLAAFNAVLAADQEIIVVVDGANPAEVGPYELNIEQTGVLSGDCCAADDSPGCVDITTTQCVCGFDVPADVAAPYPDPSDCCSGEWTAECASLAGSQCGAACDLTPGGTCCDGDSGQPNCDVGSVQDCVCAFDSFCCDTEWDASCAAKAVIFCAADCG